MVWSILFVLIMTTTQAEAVTAPVVVDESGCYVSGSQSGEVDTSLYGADPVITTTQGGGQRLNLQGVLIVVRVLNSYGVQKILITMCYALVGMGMFTLNSEVNQYARY